MNLQVSLLHFLLVRPLRFGHLLFQLQFGHIGFLIQLRDLQLCLRPDVRGFNRRGVLLRLLLLCLLGLCNLIVCLENVEPICAKQLFRRLALVGNRGNFRVGHERPEVHQRLRLLVFLHENTDATRANLIVTLDLFFRAVLHVEMIVAGQMRLGHLVIPQLDAHPQRHVVGVHHDVGCA